jgi:hypothetical protein
MISEAQKQAIRDRHPVDRVAAETVTLRRRRQGSRGTEYIGPCPICSEDPASRTATRFECDSDGWKCAVCHEGGDVIALIMKRDGVDFRQAIDRLGGAGEVEITPTTAEREGRQAFRNGLTDPPPAYEGDLARAWREGWAKQQAAERYAEFARERERKRLHAFWIEAAPIERAEGLYHYFKVRGLGAPPPRCRLRWHAAMPYFADGREDRPVMIHRGPAMLAPILSAPGGRFEGLHITWLDPAQPKGKAVIIHPDTGEVLPAKKVRGSKAGHYIDLGGSRPSEACRMIAGEGIETVLAVHADMVRAGRSAGRTWFCSAIDLGNLAGRATGTVAHTKLKTASGRAQRVPGPTSLTTSPAMPVPAEITELVLLGDGDSDPELTENALARAVERHTKDGRRIAVVWPDKIKASS